MPAGKPQKIILPPSRVVRSHRLGDMLTKEQRFALAQRLRDGRKYDSVLQGGKMKPKSADINPGGKPKSRNHGWKNGRSLARYSSELYPSNPTIGSSGLKGIEQDLLELARKNRGRPVKILDVGCGRAIALADMKLFLAGRGYKSQLEGLRLMGKLPIKSEEDLFVSILVDKMRVGSVENYKLGKNKYDFVVSLAGLQYAANQPFAIQKVCNSLRRGGKAVIQVRRSRVSIELMHEMVKQGFHISNFKTMRKSYVLHITNSAGKELNLDKFTYEALKKPIGKKMRNLFVYG